MPTWTLKDVRKSLWFEGKCKTIEAPEEGISTCRSKRATGEAMFDYVIDTRGLRRKIKNLEVVEDSESRKQGCYHARANDYSYDAGLFF